MNKKRKISLQIHKILSSVVLIPTIGLFTLACKNKEFLNQEKDNFFDINVVKKINDNFEEYQKKYFMNSYWLHRETLKYLDKVDQLFPFDFYSKWNLSENEQRIQNENQQKFDNYFKTNKATNNTLKTKEEFENLDSNILKPIFKNYLSKFFPNQNIEQIFNQYNLYYFVKESEIYSTGLSKTDLGWWWFDSLKFNKLYFIEPPQRSIVPAMVPYTGAQINIVAFKKSENIEFFESSNIDTIMKLIKI
ncbi:hypothetical protein [Mesomycoplasma hyorhinis]|uniref:Lipoprotein n=2 Tax=Mesomycoplasma hyorhinis TaxID=2100 RepID=A0ABD6IET3_MESHY|nr:hypothetical protein [Mesomycoplasma hyorhinis]MXR39058.1 hypothetical protein [Mesomycoplasma hyorhinis]MXR43976.1 hypothetical protein [Mesomycoplasma hyorhinis]